MKEDNTMDRAIIPESKHIEVTYFLLNSLASFVPGVGGAVAEVLGKLRATRIRQFMEMLVSRIEHIENKLTLLQQPACVELLEEAAEQASRGENDLKRIILARLLSASIAEDLKNHEIDRLLLVLLRDMTDYEILHLLHHFRNTPWKVREPFIGILDRSGEILDLRLAYSHSDQEDVDAEQVQMAHRARLERLGLLHNEGDLRKPRYNSTPLARLLLRRMGAISEPGK